jgi:uncharacterized protein (DUF362 family)/Pyruvate/2-oxoacid:ferredoxin oxidoreductase delta subunit
MLAVGVLEVFAGKVRKTGFFQKAGFPGNSEKILAFTRGFSFLSSRCVWLYPMSRKWYDSGMKPTVSVRACEDYEPRSVAAALERTLNDLGGLSWISSGDRVLLKPNLLKSAAPADAVVTHPTFVETVASMVLDCGATVFLGDSPPMGNLQRVLGKSGYEPFMKKLGIKAVPFVEKAPQEFPESRTYRRMDLAREVFEYDAVINLPKLKTHCQMILTLAVKNLFGTIIGTDKASWHMRAGRDLENFATVLVQIYDRVRPKLSLLDGVLAMEGNGPNAGTPRHVGIVAGAEDGVALDAVVCQLMGYPVSTLRTCVIAENLGVGIADLNRIAVTGDRLEGFPLTDFKPPKTMSVMWNMSAGHPLRRFLENYVITRPDIDADACQACGICLRHCPPQAISEVSGVMRINHKKCISCFCCHELCGNDAVRMVQPLIGRMLSRVVR